MKKMKVGIVTEISYSICNYGNVYQAFALNHYLRNKYGYEVYTIDLKKQKRTITSYSFYFAKKIKKIFKNKRDFFIVDKIASDKKKKSFKEFFEQNVPTVSFETFDEVMNYGFDMFVVGADVVWHQEHSFINSLKFFDFGNKYKPIKISYAASFGNEWIPKENKKKIKVCLEDFRGVSVRESSTIDLLKKVGVSNVKHVLDPVFLLDKSIWMTMEQKPSLVNVERYCVVYLLTPQKYEIEFINKLTEKTKIRVIIITYTDDAYGKFDLQDGCQLYSECSPQEWLWLMNHAQMVITDSFHAVAFSVIFQKQFWAMNRNKMMKRIINLLEQIGAMDRLINQDYDVEIFNSCLSYEIIRDRIEILKKESVKFLDDSLI